LKKTILLIIPNFGTGGAQRSFSNLSNELNKKFNVINVVFNQDVKLVYPLDAKIISLETASGKSLVHKLNNLFLRVIRLRKIKKQYAIDTSISFLEGADYINILSKGNEKVIISIRGSKIYDGNIKGFTGLLRKKILIPLLYKKANEIIVVNKGVAKELNNPFNLTKVSKTVISNFYDKERILQLSNVNLPEQFKWILQNQYIVISSRLSREKNILSLINVFAELKRIGFRGKMVIIGDGPEACKIEGHCRRLRLKNFSLTDSDYTTCDVICVGSDDNPYKYIRRALCFLMASESEGFPNSLVEAMILGTPVISSDCPWGPREILAPDMEYNGEIIRQPLKAKLGILMPQLTNNTESIELWANYLCQLLQDKVCLQYYSQKASEGVAIYTKEKSINEWISIIDKPQ